MATILKGYKMVSKSDIEKAITKAYKYSSFDYLGVCDDGSDKGQVAMDNRIYQQGRAIRKLRACKARESKARESKAVKEAILKVDFIIVKGGFKGS